MVRVVEPFDIRKLFEHEIVCSLLVDFWDGGSTRKLHLDASAKLQL